MSGIHVVEIIYLLVSSTYLLYFIFLRKKIDYFTLAYAAACIYFMPAYFGYVSYIDSSGLVEERLDYRSYIVYLLLLSLIFIFSLVEDALYYRKAGHDVDHLLKRSHLTCGWDKVFFVVVLLHSVIWLFFMIWTSGDNLFSPEKSEVASSVGRLHILYGTSVMIGFVFSIMLRKVYFSLCFFALILFDVYLGFRSTIVISVMAVILLYMSSIRRDLSRGVLLRYGLIILCFALLVFGYKHIYIAVKMGDLERMMEILFSENFLSVIFLNSEPFVTQAILNKVIVHNFSTDISPLIASIFMQFTFFSVDLGLDAYSFNELFQGVLFGGVDYGVASNIWAQFYSAGGWVLLIIFMIIFNLLILIANRTLYSKNIFIVFASAPIFSYLFFYIHRNDIAFILNIEKRILVTLLLLYVSFLFVKGVTRAAREA